MEYQYIYRKIDASESLETYINQQLEGVSRFLLKNSKWTVEISKSKNQPQVVIKVKSPWGYYQARSINDDFYTSVDLACDKLVNQIKKKKQQLQNHKSPERSREGRFKQISPGFDYFPNEYKNTY